MRKLKNLILSKLSTLIIGNTALVYQILFPQNFVNVYKVLVFIIAVKKYGAGNLGRKTYFIQLNSWRYNPS